MFAPASADEGMTTVGGALTDARDEDTAAGSHAGAGDPQPDGRRGSRPRAPTRDALEEPEGGYRPEHAAIVLASGGLGLISLPEQSRRMSRDEIESLHPELIEPSPTIPGSGS